MINICSVYELNDLSTNSSQFAITKRLFGVVRLTVNAIKRKMFDYDYQIVFDGAIFWSFLMNLPKMLMFSVDNSLQDVNVDKTFLKMKKKNFQVSSEGPSDDINDNDGDLEK